MSVTRLDGKRIQLSWINPSNWSIGGKILGAMFLVIVIAIGGMTAYNYVRLTDSTIQAVRDQMLAHEREAIQRSADILEGSVKSLRALALSRAIVEAVEAANQGYQGKEQAAIEAEIARLDNAWQEEDPSAGKLVDKIQNSPVSAYLVPPSKSKARRQPLSAKPPILRSSAKTQCEGCGPWAGFKTNPWRSNLWAQATRSTSSLRIKTTLEKAVSGLLGKAL